MIEVREEQLKKALISILVTPLGIVIEVSEEQEAKADFPILVTLLGIVMEVKEEQQQNANSPIFVTLLGTTKFLTNSPFKYKFLAIVRGDAEPL